MAKPGGCTIMGLGALLLLGYCTWNSSPQSRPARPWVPGMADEPAQDVLAAFAANQAAAQGQYKRPIQMLGTVKVIDATGTEDAIVMIGGPKRADSIVIVQTDGQFDAIRALRIGGPIRVQCTEVLEALSIISGQDCLVQHPDKP